MKRPWLRFYSWSSVESLNEHICTSGEKAAQYGPTSDGYEPTRSMWEELHTQECNLFEAFELCRRAHRGGPFLNFNGNTFAAIARQVLRDVRSNVPPKDWEMLESNTGHYVAGVVDADLMLKTLERFQLMPPVA